MRTADLMDGVKFMEILSRFNEKRYLCTRCNPGIKKDCLAAWLRGIKKESILNHERMYHSEEKKGIDPSNQITSRTA